MLLGGDVRGFGELEAAVIDCLWSAGGSGTVREVLEALRADRVIAYTTVLSTMDTLYRKGHLTRELEGKAHRYQTVSSHAEHTARLMQEVFGGSRDSDAVLVHFVGELTAEDQVRLRNVLAQRRRRRP
jgi:predicted transcriptional regulator